MLTSAQTFFTWAMIFLVMGTLIFLIVWFSIKGTKSGTTTKSSSSSSSTSTKTSSSPRTGTHSASNSNSNSSSKSTSTSTSTSSSSSQSKPGSSSSSTSSSTSSPYKISYKTYDGQSPHDTPISLSSMSFSDESAAQAYCTGLKGGCTAYIWSESQKQAYFFSAGTLHLAALAGWKTGIKGVSQ